MLFADLIFVGVVVVLVTNLDVVVFVAGDLAFLTVLFCQLFFFGTIIARGFYSTFPFGALMTDASLGLLGFRVRCF